jgi:L-seryl-tRNA(Ser) seleniumtransferase
MRASGAKMIEVGTTNRTRIKDYEQAITSRTKVLFKAHKSNYYIGGFSEEASLEELADLARKNDLLFIYDLGSGLLRKPEGLTLEKEPDVRSSLASGADIITFSGDKLLGGPQAGIVAGKKELIKKLSRSPLMRVLRVGKLTLAALRGVLFSYLKDESLISNLPIFKLINRSLDSKRKIAEKLMYLLEEAGIRSRIIKSEAQVGGGSLPELRIESFAVEIMCAGPRKVFLNLLRMENPVISILREGKLMFDVQCLQEEDLIVIVNTLNTIIN